jgi:ketosteroid isomerase-like protein
MDLEPPAPSEPMTAGKLGREFFAAIDARDPRRLRAALANHASFRALPHADVVRPADEIVAYFGTVVSSYPTARWEVTDVIEAGDRAAVQFIIREFAPSLGRELISEQLAIFRASDNRIISVVGYYDTAEFRRLFWDESMP